MLAAASLPEKILWAALIFLVVGYMAGTWLNRQRGKDIGAWLQAGIGSLGGRPTWKIVRSVSSGGQVSVADPVPPFSQVQINYALLTRELPPLWVYEYLTGKRDLLALRANLRATPPGEIEVLPRGGDLARRLDSSAGDAWQWVDGPGGLGIACRGRVDDRMLGSVKRLLARYGPQIQRLSIRATRAVVAPQSVGAGSNGNEPVARRVKPNGLYLGSAGPSASRPDLLLFMSMGDPGRVPAAQILNALRDVARAAQPQAKDQR